MAIHHPLYLESWIKYGVSLMVIRLRSAVLIIPKVILILGIAHSFGDCPVQAAEQMVAFHPFGHSDTSAFTGQSITIPNHGGPYTKIKFSWIENTGSLIADGNLYLLAEPYWGLPKNLSEQTPGFIARSVRTTPFEYIFEPTVELQPGAIYFFYVDHTFNLGTTQIRLDLQNHYAGGCRFVGYPNEYRMLGDEDVAFMIRGSDRHKDRAKLVLISPGSCR